MRSFAFSHGLTLCSFDRVIRGAIRESQTQLIQRVKDDIEALQEKFKAQYIPSKSYRMSKIRDIPPVASSIIWAKQIERQLNMFLGRVEDVLGKGWETHVDGQKPTATPFELNSTRQRSSKTGRAKSTTGREVCTVA
jgi:hypothetical protein